MAVSFPTDPGSPLIYYDTTTENPSTLFLTITKINKTRSLRSKRTRTRYAAMTDCSSLLAGVVPNEGGVVPVTIGPDRHAPAQVTTLVTHHAKRNIRKPIFAAQSHNADRPPSAPDTSSSRHPLLFVDPLNISGKRRITVVKKTTVFRSSAVSSAPQSHTPKPRRHPATDQPPLRGIAPPTPALPPTPHQRVTNTCGPGPPTRPTTISAAPNPVTTRPPDLPSIPAHSRA